MIDLTQARSIIESEIADNFTECPVVFENLRVPDGVDEFVAVFDEPIDEDPDGKDPSGKYNALLFSGVVHLKIHTQRGIGTARSREIAVILDNMLSGRSIGEEKEIKIKTSLYQSLGQTERNYTAVLHVPYIMVKKGETGGRTYGVQ